MNLIPLTTKIKELNWLGEYRPYGDILYYIREPVENKAQLTVLLRVSGFISPQSGIESGYSDKDTPFMCAMNMFDIRNYPELTILEVRELIKENNSL